MTARVAHAARLERLQRGIAAAAVNKMTLGKRALSADEMLEIAQVTGFPLPDFGASIVQQRDFVDVAFLERLAAATLEKLGHPGAQSRDLAGAWIKTAKRPTEPAPDDAQVRLLAQRLVRLYR